METLADHTPCLAFLPKSSTPYFWAVLFVFPIVLGFPAEVFDDKYRFYQNGDINLGAILSIHGKNRANDVKMPRDRSSNDATLAPEAETNSLSSGSERSLGVKGIVSDNNDDFEDEDDGNKAFNKEDKRFYRRNDFGSRKLRSETIPSSDLNSFKRLEEATTSSTTNNAKFHRPENEENKQNTSDISAIKYKRETKSPLNSGTRLLKELDQQESTTSSGRSIRTPRKEIERQFQNANPDETTGHASKHSATTATTGSGTGGHHFPNRKTDNKGFDSTLETICSPDIANFQALENMVAILFALDEINARTDLLPGIELGITILDDCFTPSLARARAMQFMPGASHLQAQNKSQPQPKRRRRHQQNPENHTNQGDRQQYQNHNQFQPQQQQQQRQHNHLVKIPELNVHQQRRISQEGLENNNHRYNSHHHHHDHHFERQQQQHYDLSQQPQESHKHPKDNSEFSQSVSHSTHQTQNEAQTHSLTNKTEYKQPSYLYLSSSMEIAQPFTTLDKQAKTNKPSNSKKEIRKESKENSHSVTKRINLPSAIKQFDSDTSHFDHTQSNIVRDKNRSFSRYHTEKSYHLDKQRLAPSSPYHLLKNNTDRTGLEIGLNTSDSNQTFWNIIARDNFRLRKHYVHPHYQKPQNNRGKPTLSQEKEVGTVNNVIVVKKNKTDHVIKRRAPDRLADDDRILKPDYLSPVSQSKLETNEGKTRGIALHQPSCNHTVSIRKGRGIVLRNQETDTQNTLLHENKSLRSKKHRTISSKSSPSLSLSGLSSPPSPSTVSPPLPSLITQTEKSIPTSKSSPSVSHSRSLSSILDSQHNLSSIQRHISSRKPRAASQGHLYPSHQLPTFYDVVGIVGAYTSSLSVEVADVMTIFNLPQISHAATTDILGDKMKYPVFFRTVPADYYQIQTMAELLRHFQWKYISIVFSADAYGTRAEKNLRTLLHDLDICIAQSVELNDSMALTDYENVIFNLRSHKNARVVVLYADIKHISPLMTAVREKNAYQEFIWAGSDTTSLVSEMEEENCRHIIGSLSITMNSSSPPKFKEYLYKYLNKSEKTLHQFAWQDPEKLYALFHEFSDVVRLKHLIDGKYFERTSVKYRPTFTVSYAIDAVYAFAHAIQDFIDTNCPGAKGENAKRCIQGKSIIPYLKSVNFTGTSGNVCFDEHGDVVGRIAISQCQIHDDVSKQVDIATWAAKDTPTLNIRKALQWPNQSISVPRSLCSKTCAGNEIYVFPKQTCCWNCVKCKVNEISIKNKTVCRQCPDLYWPEETKFLACHKIQPSYIRMLDLLPLTLAIITILGLMISFVTGFTFYTYRSDRIIRSSSKELSSIMLVGVFCAFLLVLSLLSEPTIVKCYINHVGFGMTFTMVYGPLLVKTNRIYRIFTTSRKSAALPKRTSSAWQLLFASGFVLIQITIVTISIIFAPPKVTHSMPVKTDKYVIGYCDLALAGFLSSIAYNLALVLVCTWYAFKTRRLPDNYNESRYIAFCVDTTVIVWVTFIPTYFAMKRPYYKVVILALALLINSIVCLLLLFVPKMYALYISKQRLSNQSSGAEQARDFHMQLMSNFSMSGLIRSTPSFYYGDSNDAEEKTDSVFVQSPPVSSKRTSEGVSGNELSCINEQGVHFVSSAAVLITTNSQADS